MSKFRCEIDISFNTEADAVSFLNLLQSVKKKLFKGSGDEEIFIKSTVRYHECFHDETPPKPCGDYINYDLKKVEVEEIKTKAGVKVEAGDLLKPKGEEL